eukprot:9447220-Pyramimonas_sp.AAC.1
MTTLPGGVRSHAVTVISGPVPFPATPTAKWKDVDAHHDQDGGFQFDTPRGSPERLWSQFMADDATSRLGPQ